jgi:hypothetical protein
MSKFMYFDFQCPVCSLIIEDFVKPDTVWIECPKCQGTAKRILTPVRIDRTAIACTLGASPESIAHFDRIHRQQKAIEQKNFENHGDYGKSPGSD